MSPTRARKPRPERPTQAFRLAAQIRTPTSYPIYQVRECLELLASQLARVDENLPVLMITWIQWLKSDPRNEHALVRVMLLLTMRANLDSEAVKSMAREVGSVAPRLPATAKRIREVRERTTTPLL